MRSLCTPDQARAISSSTKHYLVEGIALVHALKILKIVQDPRYALLSDHSSLMLTEKCSGYKAKGKILTHQGQKFRLWEFQVRVTLNEKLLKEYFTDSDGAPNSSMLPHSSPC